MRPLTFAGFVSQLLEIVIAIGLAPLLTGWVNLWRAWLQNNFPGVAIESLPAAAGQDVEVADAVERIIFRAFRAGDLAALEDSGGMPIRISPEPPEEGGRIATTTGSAASGAPPEANRDRVPDPDDGKARDD